MPPGELLFINLETPISDKVAPLIRRSKNPGRLKVVFRMPTRFTPLLRESGVDLAVLANNHAEDCGVGEIRSTVEALEKNGVESVGAHPEEDPHQARILETGGHKIAVIAGTLLRNYVSSRKRNPDPLAFVDYRTVKAYLREAVSKARKQYPDHLVVLSLHWGKRGAFDVPLRRRKVARLAIDSGADVFWGHHTHTLQPPEIYRGGLILYSMGNLVFDMRGAPYRRSGIVELDASRGKTGTM